MTNLIINTDMGCDADDVGAIALVNTFINLKETNVLAITHGTSNFHGIGCTNVINKYYNNEIDLGKYVGNEFLPKDGYAKAVTDKFLYEESNYIESVKLIRQKLLKAKDKSITLVSIGQLNIFNALLNSKADDEIPLTGYELIQSKVKETVIMGGYFNKPPKPISFEGNEYTVEFNIEMDIKASRNFIENAPSRLIFIDFYIGYLVKTMKPLLDELNLNNPITYAYKTYNKGPRESWDLLAVYYAVRGLDDMFDISDVGHVKVSNDGATNFYKDNLGLHQIITLKKEPEHIGEIINNLIIDNLPGGNES